MIQHRLAAKHGHEHKDASHQQRKKTSLKQLPHESKAAKKSIQAMSSGKRILGLNH
jgi:hypothetical protein